MGRPAQPKSASVQLGVLSRMLRQVEVDDRMPQTRRRRISRLIADLMSEFQRDVGDGCVERAS